MKLSPQARNDAAMVVTAPANGGSLALLAGDRLLAMLPLRFELPTNGTARATVEDTEANGDVEPGGEEANRYVVHTDEGTPRWEGTVGALGSDADLQLEQTLVRPGQRIEITAFNYTQPE